MFIYSVHKYTNIYLCVCVCVCIYVETQDCASAISSIFTRPKSA